MRSYPRNSPEAAARIVALVVPAGGDTQRAEIECLGHLTVHGQRGAAQQESYALLDSFCEDFEPLRFLRRL